MTRGRSRLRVLFLTHRLPYAPNRGDRIRAYHLIEALSGIHDVRVISLLHDREELDRVREVSKRVPCDGVPIRGVIRYCSAALSLGGHTPLTHVLLHSPNMHGVIERRVAEMRPEVVVAYCTGMAKYAVQAPLAAIPLVLDMVDVDSEKWAALGGRIGGLKGWIFRREARVLRAFEREAVSRARATIVSSERERELLDRCVPGSRSVTVANGIDVDFFRAKGPAPESATVIFCGVFSYQPNEDGAVWLASRVWPSVRERRPDARLMLVGMHPSSRVRALADQSVTVTGAVPDVRRYLWDAAVAVAPLHVARGVQNKVLEAVAAGLPTVVTPAVYDGLPPAVRCACVVEDEAERFADALVTLLSRSGQDRRRMAERADLSLIRWETQLAPFLDIVAAAAA